MRGLVVAGAALGLLTAGCATTSHDQSHAAHLLGADPAVASIGPQAAGLGSGSQLVRIGPVHVMIRPQPEVELICRLRALTSSQLIPANRRVLGCYVPADKIIVSTADPYVLLHEFKHYFEGSFHK